MLSPHELSRFIVDPSMPHTLDRLFQNCPTHIALLRSYLFLTRSMDHLEHVLERHRVEQHALFQRLVDSKIFEPRIEPLIRDFRQRDRRSRFHPYSRFISTIPSFDNPPTSSNIETQPGRRSVNSLPSYTEEEEELGTRGNPICVLGDDECEGCHEDGHFIGTCTREYQLVGNQYVPIPDTKNTRELTYIVDADHFQQQQQ
jgi:hypothetical protein